MQRRYSQHNPYLNPPLNTSVSRTFTVGNANPMDQSAGGGVLTTSQGAGALATTASWSQDLKEGAELVVKGAALIGGVVIVSQLLSIWQTHAERKNLRIAAGTSQ